MQNTHGNIEQKRKMEEKRGEGKQASSSSKSLSKFRLLTADVN